MKYLTYLLYTALLYTATLTLCVASSGFAQAHRGQMDTDGILSPGEVRNPRINYNHREYERGRNQARSAPAAEPHRGQVDTDGTLSPGEIPNPLISYNERRHDPYWYSKHDWDHSWDTYNEDYWRRYPERRWWRDDDAYWRPDSSFSNALRDGIRSGRISSREENELRGMRADLLRREQEYWRDGHLSRDEREDLEGRAGDLRNAFNHEMNDGERRR